MKKINWTTIIIAILIIAGLFIWLKTCKPATKPEVIATTGDSTQFYRNRAGVLTAALKKSEDRFAEVSTFWIDSIAKVYKTKVKYIQSAAVVTTQTDTVFQDKEVPVITYVDSGKGNTIQSVSKNFSSPPWFNANVKIDLTGQASSIDLQTNDSTTIVWKTVKEGNIFNRKTFMQVDVSNASPFNQIKGIKAYRQPVKVSQWNKWIKPTLVGAAAGFVTFKLTKN